MGKANLTPKTETETADLTESQPNRKRKRGPTTTPIKSIAPLVDLTMESDGSSPTKKRVKSSPKKRGKDEEKRLRMFRSRPPHTYLDRLNRAQTQRMFVIDRLSSGTADVPEQTIQVAGTTGNIYSVHIAHEPSCTCPDHLKGNQCKHIVYVLHNVLKAPEHLQYQLALLSSELREIFSSAPAPISLATADPHGDVDGETSSNRKPCEGDCPICFMPFSPDEEEIVWCRAACGNNVHADCFEQWAKSQAGKEVKCVYCRTPWKGDEEQMMRICREKAKSTVDKSGGGYVNVAQELGLSGARGNSS
ncbi:uncharacterized protein KY384_006905 [Bacidia gigantensis]|uniref:uncharacterized protein n=1 Tax=Bacidia gigantensis TaxID=2732470 RepID=UPI001D044373|nr:uncharacterized protein KY384_006905 [Bacidia gigantensis]KAG8527989.1 hypothetical protein KY384_006905 [Bacidia gigantensis]